MPRAVRSCRPVLSFVAAVAVAVPLATSAPSYAASAGSSASGGAQPAATYSAPLTQAISSLPVAAEVRTGYDRSKFKLWIDADGDGCDTREEVLLDEAEDAPTKGSGCSLSGGRWYSYYDAKDYTSASSLDIDHVVPLAEVWDSGGRNWSAQTRQDYANDLGDYRTLIAVDASDNRSKGDQDIAEWTPAHQVCRYLDDWVAIKHRWSLDVDSTEKSAMQRLASGCSDVTITVTLASTS